MMASTVNSSRRPTAPIPPHLVQKFYAIAWAIAASDGEDHTRRRHAIACLWLTACALRFSELRRLKVSDVSAVGFSAFISRSKGGLSGRLELSKRLVDVTFAWRACTPATQASEWLIPSRTGRPLSINSFNRDACGFFSTIIGLPLSSHCFRDTACQLALVQGASVRTVQRLMGHRSAVTTEVYVAKQKVKAFRVDIESFEGGK